MKIKALIATPETDAKLAKEYRRKGAKASAAGLPRTPPCDPNSMIGGWWFQGFDGIGAPAVALASAAQADD